MHSIAHMPLSVDSGSCGLDCNIIIKNTKQFQMIKEEEIQAQSLDSNPSVEFQYLTTKTYQDLLHSHEQAKLFISQLGDLKTTPLCESLAVYTRDLMMGHKTCEMVLDLMESRLNKMIKNNRLKKNWSEEDLQILVWLLSKYMEKNAVTSHEMMSKEDWERLASMIPGSTARGCLFKFVSLKKFKLAHHKWQKEEENLLYKIIAEIGTKNWKIISQRLYQENPKKKLYRTAKQCRQHWSCYLDPKIKKGPWEREEDRKLLQIVLDSNCQKKWSLIKQDFSGRTENALKNRYNLLLEKQRKLRPQLAEVELILQLLKEEKEDTDDQTRKSQKQPSKSGIQVPEPIFPVVPEQHRSQNLQVNQGYLIFYDGVNPNPWFFQM